MSCAFYCRCRACCNCLAAYWKLVDIATKVRSDGVLCGKGIHDLLVVCPDVFWEFQLSTLNLIMFLLSGLVKL